MELVAYVSIPHKGESIHRYIDFCNNHAKEHNYKFDTIQVDDGRFVMIPISDDLIFLMSCDIMDGKLQLGDYTTHQIVQGNDLIDIISEK